MNDRHGWPAKTRRPLLLHFEVPLTGRLRLLDRFTVYWRAQRSERWQVVPDDLVLAHWEGAWVRVQAWVHFERPERGCLGHAVSG